MNERVPVALYVISADGPRVVQATGELRLTVRAMFVEAKVAMPAVCVLHGMSAAVVGAVFSVPVMPPRGLPADSVAQVRMPITLRGDDHFDRSRWTA